MGSVLRTLSESYLVGYLLMISHNNTLPRIQYLSNDFIVYIQDLRSIKFRARRIQTTGVCVTALLIRSGYLALTLLRWSRTPDVRPSS